MTDEFEGLDFRVLTDFLGECQMGPVVRVL